MDTFILYMVCVGYVATALLSVHAHADAPWNMLQSFATTMQQCPVPVSHYVSGALHSAGGRSAANRPLLAATANLPLLAAATHILATQVIITQVLAVQILATHVIATQFLATQVFAAQVLATQIPGTQGLAT